MFFLSHALKSDLPASMPPIVDSSGDGGQSALPRFEVSSAPDGGDVVPTDAGASLVFRDDNLTVSERATLASAVLAVGF